MQSAARAIPAPIYANLRLKPVQAGRVLRAVWTSLAMLALGVAVPATAYAAEDGSVTLVDVVRNALSPDNLATILQDETVKAAAGKLQQAKGQFDWAITTQDGPSLLFIPKYQVVKGVNQVVNPDATVTLYGVTGSVGREFRNGITLAPGVTDYFGPSSVGGFTQIRPSLGLKIPLWRGLGEESADAAERAAKDSLSAAKRSRVYAVAQAVQTDVLTFWKCLADDQIAQIAENSDRNAQAYQQSLDALAKRGMVEPITAQQNAANNVMQQLTTRTAEDTATVCRRDLAYATTGATNGPYPSPSGELPAIEPLADAVDRLNADALIQLALEQRPDLKAAEQNVEAAEENVRYAHDQTHPEIDFHVDQLSATVLYSQSIQNNAAEGAEAQASAAKSQAEVALRQLQDQIHFDVGDAVRNLKRTVSDWSAVRAAEARMERVVTDADKQAKYGSIPWGSFLAAEGQLAAIQQQAVTTRLQFAASLATLRLVTGTIVMDGETPKIMAEKFMTLPAN